MAIQTSIIQWIVQQSTKYSFKDSSVHRANKALFLNYFHNRGFQQKTYIDQSPTAFLGKFLK